MSNGPDNEEMISHIPGEFNVLYWIHVMSCVQLDSDSTLLSLGLPQNEGVVLELYSKSFLHGKNYIADLTIRLLKKVTEMFQFLSKILQKKMML